MNQFNPYKIKSLLNSKSKPVVPSTNPLGRALNVPYPSALPRESESVQNNFGKPFESRAEALAMRETRAEPETITSSYEKMLRPLSFKQRSDLNERRATRLSDLQMEGDIDELLKQKTRDEERARGLARYGLK
jgi:hypothetical protein